MFASIFFVTDKDKTRTQSGTRPKPRRTGFPGAWKQIRRHKKIKPRLACITSKPMGTNKDKAQEREQARQGASE